jgi:hypothetical protein
MEQGDAEIKDGRAASEVGDIRKTNQTKELRLRLRHEAGRIVAQRLPGEMQSL